MTDQPTLRDRIVNALRADPRTYVQDYGSAERIDANLQDVADAVLAALPAPADRAEEELRYWKSKLAAVTDGRDALQRENARLRKDLAAAERIRENADFHLGQEMARRQLAEKAAANPTVDRAAVLREAADAAEDVSESLRSHHEFERSTGALDVMAELRRMADEAQQPEEAGR